MCPFLFTFATALTIFRLHRYPDFSISLSDSKEKYFAGLSLQFNLRSHDIFIKSSDPVHEYYSDFQASFNNIL